MIASPAPDSLGDWPALVYVGIALIALAWLALLALCRTARTPIAASAHDETTAPTRATTCPHWFKQFSGRVWKCAYCPELEIAGVDEPFDQDAAAVVEAAEAILREVAE